MDGSWMGLYDQRRHWLYCIGLLDGSYHIIWIVFYWLDCIISAGLYCIGWIVSVNTGFYDLDGYWLDGTDGTYGLDGTLVEQVGDGPTLSSAGTGAPTLDLEGRRAVGSGGWHQLNWCYKGAEYLCRSRRIIKIDCKQIGTNMRYKIV